MFSCRLAPFSSLYFPLALCHSHISISIGRARSTLFEGHILLAGSVNEAKEIFGSENEGSGRRTKKTKIWEIIILQEEAGIVITSFSPPLRKTSNFQLSSSLLLLPLRKNLFFLLGTRNASARDFRLKDNNWLCFTRKKRRCFPLGSDTRRGS